MVIVKKMEDERKKIMRIGHPKMTRISLTTRWKGESNMVKKAVLCFIAVGMALSAAGCKQVNYKMKEQQNPNLDRRGMKDEHYLENQVNNNLPGGDTSGRMEYEMRQNIRAGDANGGVPHTTQGDNVIEPGSMRQIPSP